VADFVDDVAGVGKLLVEGAARLGEGHPPRGVPLEDGLAFGDEAMLIFAVSIFERMTMLCWQGLLMARPTTALAEIRTFWK
jgi:hypothetical protein